MRKARSSRAIAEDTFCRWMDHGSQVQESILKVEKVGRLKVAQGPKWQNTRPSIGYCVRTVPTSFSGQSRGFGRPPCACTVPTAVQVV
jgi:hypothetical protein